MSDQSRTTRRRRRSWIPWVAAAFGILLLIFLLAPRRVSRLRSIDGRHQWSLSDAPRARTVIWQPAEKVDPVGANVRKTDSLIRPQLADDGNTLYFTIRAGADGKKDIYRSQLVDGSWQEPKPVKILNSNDDDIGPIISQDGSTLYLYSNRGGGHGGFDIYVSKQDGKSWTQPVNLGPNINSPADEYDPAVTPDGERLFFASSRSARMQRMMREGTLQDSRDAWDATVRADPGNSQFDLYSTELDNNEWKFAEPLAAVNLQYASEASPFVSPEGAFLYFVSDRRNAHQERNFDVYRVRLLASNRLGRPENLGGGVNTAANEIEPALSEEGFRLYFSRNDAADAPDSNELRYSLYASTAIESEVVREWDDSRWKAFTGFLYNLFINNWWWVVLLLILAALVAALLWYIRQVSLKRATVPIFLLGAFFFHALLGVGSFFVDFDALVKNFPKPIREMFVATTVESEPKKTNNPANQQAYEKVADLEAIESVQTSEVQRQVVESNNVPQPTNFEIKNLPTRFTPAKPLERQVFVPPQETLPEPTELARRSAQDTPQVEQVELEMSQRAVPLPAEERVKPESVEVEAVAEPATQTANAPQLARRSPIADRLLQQDTIPAERTETEQPQSRTNPTLARAQRVLPQPEEQPAIETAPLTPVAPAAIKPIKVEAVQIARQTQQAASNQQPTTLPMRRRATDLTKIVESSIERVTNESDNPQALPTPTPLKRTPQANQLATNESAVETETLPNAVATATPALPTATDITLQRRSVTPLQAEAPKVSVEIESSPVPTTSPTAVPPRQASDSSPQVVINDAPARKTPAVSVADLPQVQTENLVAQADAPASSQPAPAAIKVEMQRANIEQPQTTAGELALARRTVNLPSIQKEDVAVESESSANAPAMLAAQTLAKRISQAAQGLTVESVEITPTTEVVAENANQFAATVESVDFAKQEEITLATAQTNLTELPARRGSANLLHAPAAIAREEAVPTPGMRSTEATSLARRQRTIEPTVEPETVGSEALASAEGDSADSARPLAGAVVDLQRNNSRTGDFASTPGLLRRRRPASQTLQPLEDAVPTEIEVAANSPRSTLGEGSLIRRQTPLEQNNIDLESEVEVDTLQTPTPSLGSKQRRPQAVNVDVLRPDGIEANVPLRTLAALGGRHNPLEPRLIVGELARVEHLADLSGQPRNNEALVKADRLPKLPVFAEDNIGLQALLRMRGADDETKEDLIKAFGGRDETLVTIRTGLEWLRRHQFPDGHWGLHNFHECCKKHGSGRCNGNGSTKSDTAATGFALLPFLGDGHTHLEGKYKDTVRRGLEWLQENQSDEGDLFTGGEGNAHLYSHGIATIALCEAYALSKDPKLKEPAQRAVDFIVKSQHGPSGGWRYRPGQAGDTSVLGWQVMALKSAQMADLDVPKKTLDGARKWLQHVSANGKRYGRFGYTHKNDVKTAMTAEALLCKQYLGAERTDKQLVAGADFLLENLPQHRKESSYYWYYGTQVMYHMQGTHWEQWNTALQEEVLKNQNRRRQLTGSWDPRDQWERSGGRVYATAIRILMLEVVYRHLPLYETLHNKNG